MNPPNPGEDKSFPSCPWIWGISLHFMAGMLCRGQSDFCQVPLLGWEHQGNWGTKRPPALDQLPPA